MVAARSALVVEDNEDIALFVSVVLGHLGFAVQNAKDGQAALDTLAAAPLDLVVLDLNIPKISGVEVMRRIRADERLAATKIVVVSANPHMIDGLDDLADLVLQKPFNYRQLHDLVQRLF
jgi:DNA-binding response OmpR family regulator